MKMVVKYTLENRATNSNTEVGLTTPECIDDGGHFFDRLDDTLIGYCDDTHSLGVTCIEITEAELEARKLRLSNTHECAIRSDGQHRYTAPADEGDGIMVSKACSGNGPDSYYKIEAGDSSLYSDRAEGRKKYRRGNIPAEMYSQPDSDSQILTCYSEIEGVTQEWYYDFTTFEVMMSFVNSHKPISLNPALEAKMRDTPLSVKPNLVVNAGFMCLASLEITASGDKITTVYVTTQPEEVNG